jgi:hypothetical protein
VDDLVEWLRAQLDEDERVANAATEGPWRVTIRSDSPYAEDGEIHTVAVHARYRNDSSPEPYRVVTHGDFHEAIDRPDADHIVRWDPARVLREVEAKRRRLVRHRPVTAADTDWVACSHCHTTYPCDDIRDDLLPYSDRPGYPGGVAALNEINGAT